MSNISSDAKEEVKELHKYVERLESENRKWRYLSLGLAALSVLISLVSFLPL